MGFMNRNYFWLILMLATAGVALVARGAAQVNEYVMGSGEALRIVCSADVSVVRPAGDVDGLVVTCGQQAATATATSTDVPTATPPATATATSTSMATATNTPAPTATATFLPLDGDVYTHGHRHAATAISGSAAGECGGVWQPMVLGEWGGVYPAAGDVWAAV